MITGHSGLLLLPWVGDRALFTASIALSSVGIEASVEGPAIRIHGTGADDIASAIRRLLASPPPSADLLASSIRNRVFDKWDWVLDDALSCESAGVRLLDVDGAWSIFTIVAPNRRRPGRFDSSDLPRRPNPSVEIRYTSCEMKSHAPMATWVSALRCRRLPLWLTKPIRQMAAKIDQE